MQLLAQSAVALIVGVIAGSIFIPVRGWIYQTLRHRRGSVKYLIPVDYPAKVGFIFAGVAMARAAFTKADKWEDACVLFSFSVGATLGCRMTSFWGGPLER